MKVRDLVVFIVLALYGLFFSRVARVFSGVVLSPY